MGAMTPRERARAQTLVDITRIGREHLSRHGAAALSLRAVARDLGVVSSAVYRYVRSRDELLTLLLVDGYDELADAVDAALAAVPREQFRLRLLTLGRAVRAWALAEPATYALLYGGPVPGYAAPGEQTTGPGTRVARTMVGLLDDAHRAGVATDPDDPPPGEALAAGLAAVRAQLDADLPDRLLARGVLAWTSLFGAVSFEVFGQYGPDGLGDPAELFERHLAGLADRLGLPPVTS